MGDAGRSTTPQPSFTSFSAARERIDINRKTRWHEHYNDTANIGKQDMFQSKAFHLLSTSIKKHWMLRTYGRSPEKFARAVRFATGHFPHGAFRKRFNKPGRQDCWCGAALETRDHILFECPLWIRDPTLVRYVPTPHSATRRRKYCGGALDLGDMSDGDDTDDVQLEQICQDPTVHVSAAELKTFLENNPAVGTFEWLDMVQDIPTASLGLRPTYAALQAHAHSTVRAAAWKAAETAMGRFPPRMFHDAWDHQEVLESMVKYYFEAGEELTQRGRTVEEWGQIWSTLR